MQNRTIYFNRTYRDRISSYNLIEKKNNRIIYFDFQLTWADIFLAAFLDQWLAMYHVDGISRFSLLTDLKNKVNECPAIKAYLAKRKDTPF